MPASVTLPGCGNRGLGRTSMMVSGLRPAMPVPRTGSMQASGLTLRGMTILSCVAIRVSRRAVEMWRAIVSYPPPPCWIRRQVGAPRKNLGAELCVCDEASEEKIRNYKSQQNEKESVNENMCAPLLELLFGLGFRHWVRFSQRAAHKKPEGTRPRRVTPRRHSPSK